jgi:DNA-binding NarL/FixJ family response regulator
LVKGLNIIVVDDEKLFRNGLISLLKNEGINVIAEASDGEELFSMIKKKLPDIVLLDLEMPKMNGSKTLNKLKAEHPEQKVIILSKYHDEDIIKDCFNRGANAFVSKKTCGVDIVINAIERVRDYGIYKDNLPCLLSNPAIKDGHYYKLIFSGREIQILYWLCNSKSYKEIGETLFISSNTVENHTKSMFKKTNLKSREELVTLAYKNGLNYLGGH